MSRKDDNIDELERLRARVRELEQSLRISELPDTELERAVLRDRARRRRAETSHDFYESLFESFMDSNDDALFVHDAGDGQILFVNRRCTQMLGYPRDILHGETVGFFSQGTGPYTDERALDQIHKAARDGKNNFEWWCRDSQARQMWVDVNLKSMNSRTRRMVLARVRHIGISDWSDLTPFELDEERKNLHELVAMNRKLRLLSDAIPQIVFIADPMGSVVFWNYRFYELTGLRYSPEQAVSWFDLIHPEDRPDFTREWMRCVASGDTFEYEFRLTRDRSRRNGSPPVYLWFLARAVASFKPSGAIAEWYGTFTQWNR
ncbi:MAG: PAS domain S-box protein [Candidatus Melainabacteria bacterium]|nr:PAS domain S-box protein [Candidatus Melainabacteria bacterium]